MKQPTFDPVEENLLLRRWVNHLSEILIGRQILIGQLTDNPRKCCLIKLRFSTSDIAIMIGIAATSVAMRSTAFRKK